MNSYAHKTREELQAEAAAVKKDKHDWINAYGRISAHQIGDVVARFSDLHGVGYDLIIHKFELYPPRPDDRAELPGLIGLEAKNKRTARGEKIYAWISVWDLLRHRPIDLWNTYSRFTSASKVGDKHSAPATAVSTAQTSELSLNQSDFTEDFTEEFV